MKNQVPILAICLLAASLAAQPATFNSRGTGGGGGMFVPAVNPFDPQEIYLASDLGGLYHTKNSGLKYEVVPGAVTGVFSKVCFTSDPLVRYGIFYDRSNFDDRPAKTTDGGQTWAFLPGDNQPGESKLFIFADRTNPQRVLWTDYNHVYFSNNGGQTSALAYTALDNGAGVLLSGVFWDGQNIYLGTNDGVIRSANGGQTFANANFPGIAAGSVIMGFGGAKQGGTLRFFALAGNKADIYAATAGENFWYQVATGVYSLDNAAGSWQPKNTGINFSNDFVCWLACAENDISTCWLAGGDNNSQTRVLKTTNAGTNWQNVFQTTQNANIFTSYAGDGGDFNWGWAGNALGFGVNPLDASQAVITDYGFLHQTKNGGTDWHQIYSDPAGEHPKNALTPKKQLYKSVGMEQTTCWQVYHFDANNLFGCFTDIKGVRSDDGGQKWSFDYSGHTLNTMYRIVKQTGANRWFGGNSGIHDIYETTYITDARLFSAYSAGQVLWTTDKGKAWQLMRDFGRPVIWLATDPTNAERLWVAVIDKNNTNGGLWRADGISNPATAVWTKISNPPTANVGRIFNVHVLNDGTLVTTWCAKKSDAGSTFSNGSGVFVSTNGGTSWLDRSHANMKYWTKDLVIDPNDATQNTWYACVWSAWGGNGNDLGRLWRTTNRGVSWQAMTAANQFLRVSSVTIDPSDAETMYLTTEDQGFWVTHNKSAASPTWTRVEAYPHQHPSRVFFNPFNTKEMWVAGFGWGMAVGGDCALTAAVIGSGDVCADGTMTYSTAAFAGATYLWTVAGGAIVSGQGTNAISVLWGAGGAGEVKVLVSQ